MKKLIWITFLSLGLSSAFAQGKIPCDVALKEMGSPLTTCKAKRDGEPLQMYLFSDEIGLLTAVYCDDLDDSPNVVKGMDIWHDSRQSPGAKLHIQYYGKDYFLRTWRIYQFKKTEVTLEIWPAFKGSLEPLLRESLQCTPFELPFRQYN